MQQAKCNFLKKTITSKSYIYRLMHKMVILAVVLSMYNIYIYMRQKLSPSTIHMEEDFLISSYIVGLSIIYRKG